MAADSGGESRFKYDSLGRLVGDSLRTHCGDVTPDSVSGDSWVCTHFVSSHAFSYDAMGNRTDQSASIGTGNRISSFDGITISYDADGNVTEKKKPGSYDRKYFWSAESRLDSASLDGSSMVKYDYNAFGKPVRKSRRTSGTSWAVDSYFLWNGEQLLAELDSAGHRKSD